LKDLISSVFSHELKNTLASIRFGIEMLAKYDMSKEEEKEFIKNILNTINNSIQILDEYMEFMKFQFRKKLKYESVDIYELLLEIQKELKPFIEQKSIHMYIQKNHLKIVSNRFWLKRALYNIILNAIKYNNEGGNINIKIENDLFGIYISISDTGIGIHKKDLSTIFKMFHQIDENQNGVGIGLALAHSVIDTFGGKIHVKSNEEIGTDFILYIPKKPKEITLKKIAFGLLPASVIFFLGISYFPIYSQNYTKLESSQYIVYKLEDGSVLKYTKNSKYTLSMNKNLYNTKFVIDTTLTKGDLSLKAIKNKASIKVNGREFNNLGTDFEVIRDNETKVAVFDGKVKTNQVVVNRGEGGIVEEHIQVVSLLPAPKYLTIKDDILEFKKEPDQKKYKIIVSLNRDFSYIKTTLFSVNNKIKLSFDEDTLYYIKVFAYDKYGLPSMPAVIKHVSLNHYKRALLFEKHNISQAIEELKNSISTIKHYSSLPYYELAKIYYQKKDYPKAVKYISLALNISKKKEYYYILYDSYYRLHKYDKFKDIDKLVEKYPNDYKLLFYKSVALYHTKDYKTASKLLFRVLQQKPHFKDGNILMSKILMKLNKVEEANYYKRLAK